MFNIYTMTNCWEIPLELLCKLHRFFILITSESARDHDDQLIFYPRGLKTCLKVVFLSLEKALALFLPK